MQFSDFQLGETDAGFEVSEHPDLLRTGFYDLGGNMRSLIDGPKFLILGYKGSGKSAFGEKLAMEAADRVDLECDRPVSLKGFPYAQFTRIVVGEGDETSRFALAWKVLLQAQLIEKVANAETDMLSGGILNETLKSLDQLQMRPSPQGLPPMVVRSAKRTFSVDVKKVLGLSGEANYETQEATLGTLESWLSRRISLLKWKPRHLLVLDGLDEIVRGDDRHNHVILALLEAVADLNDAWSTRKSNGAAKAVVICRTDLFERLPGANKNKLRQSRSIELSWYDKTRQHHLTHLNLMLNRRVQVSQPKTEDFISTYFPTTLEGVASHGWLLSLTRHTPRDVIALMKAVQAQAGERQGRLTRDVVLAGTRDYSQGYLLPEMRDELYGRCSEAQRELIFAFLGMLRKKKYSIAELRDLVGTQKRFQDLDLESGLELLFDCSAIGNTYQNDRGTYYYVFRYRNPRATLSFEQDIAFHLGLQKEMAVA